MMNRFLLLIFISIITLSASAQSVCEPDTSFKRNGYKPDVLDTAYVDSFYESVIYFNFPKDTIIDLILTKDTIPLDSFIITSVTGAPGSIISECNASRCKYEGGDSGCVRVYGTPVSGEDSTYTVAVTIDAFAFAFGSPYRETFTDYISFTVVDKGPGVYISRIKKPKISIYPNPVQQGKSLFISSNKNIEAVSILDMNGRQQKLWNPNSSEVSIPINRMEAGVYILSFVSGEYMIRKRFIIIE